METLIIELTNQKAYKLIKDLEDLNIIKVLKKPGSLSSLRGKIQTKMNNEDIDKQFTYTSRRMEKNQRFRESFRLKIHQSP